MSNLTLDQEISESIEKAEPLCPVFGVCGGCSYQDISYAGELLIKGRKLRRLFADNFDLPEDVFQAIVPSPEAYHYRNRLDLTLCKLKGNILIGFQPASSKRLVLVDSCPIARKEISEFIPKLQKEASAKLPVDYRRANLVVRTGDDGRVLWGGIGRRSLVLKEEDYLWTEVSGKRIFYALDTFFQANLAILPRLIETIRPLAHFDKETFFWDFYSGVGLFGICFADQVKGAVMIEESADSARLAHFNVKYHGLKNIEIREGKVERELPRKIEKFRGKRNVGFVDPPRKGLSAGALEVFAGQKKFESFFYLSCRPESLIRDLKAFWKRGWKIERVIPFDFFPRTSHLEVLVLLKP